MKKGAQPTNVNALKHGFYSRKFRKLEAADLALVCGNLTDEITLVRILIRRMNEYLHKNQKTMEAMEIIKAFTALTDATATLATLLRSQQILGSSPETELANALTQALQEISKEPRKLIDKPSTRYQA